MTHRRDAILLWLKDDDETWEKIIIENRHSYYPVCGESTDDIKGVLGAKDYLALPERSRDEALAKAVKSAQLVPDTVRANVLFRKMKTRRNHFAVVLDEYGSMDGIITMNDLLEELVGDLTEGDDAPELPLIEKKGAGLWRVSGAASLDRLSRETGVKLPEENYDTFGGFVFTLLGRIPEDGEVLELEVEGLKISVTEIKDHRLESALVSLCES
jgi:putative hemolysin